ncbi:T9SS type A sorting domain-containing protein [Cytophaga hutchinsonii]|uniref:CHU large protein uncharacterized n=1 Tax=Cytophaga hutchinsonii (strain ATCC 33406 / DSM 1761 / CIP 103989 / NBRC 15051 / NCIMB 9469 / D465) TaxID=269798 RepID=A0A6N4SPW3_CYTH3|nr:T9SS type A sorting domain-containing protein [Cytophaga hutchinsonii]ABG58304.1 CHU large protein; uncharacterized [Cytophaga hutchinsonii ATCC 33406]SFX52950.1 hypothetical protein SAMN04487930_105125 [Cytophaga hutchinsonii ATCC 33406]
MVLKNKFIFLVGLFISSVHVFANVSVTSAGNLNLCVGNGFSTIGKITIAEGVMADFSSNATVQTYEINAPSNFEFNPGNGSVTASGNDITFSALTVTATKITLYYLATATATVDKFELTNIQIKATNSSGSQNIVRTGGTATQAGNAAYTNTHASVSANQANVNLNLGSLNNLCINSGDKTLSGGTPGGGTYLGTGVSGSTFSPVAAGTGSYTITYTASQNGCSGTATATITVNPKPSVTFFGLDNTYCSNGLDDQLTGFPSGGTFSGSMAISGTLFKPSVPSVGVKNITYSYTDANGCSGETTQQTTILEAPTVSITLDPAKSTYAINDVPVKISGTQNNPSSGGTIILSGNGVSNSTALFTPSAAGVGTHIISRTIKAPNGCSATETREMTVSNTNNIIINGLAEKYCEYNAPVLLSTNLGTGTFSGEGITEFDASTGTATFNPALVDFGNQQQVTVTINLNYAGLINFPQTTTIHKRPQVTIIQDTVAPNFRKKFCNQDATVPMSVSTYPSGGTGEFSGSPAISGNNFNPANATIGSINTNTVLYTYTDLNNCTNTDSKTVIVNAVTTGLDFSGLNSKYCDKASIAELKPLNGETLFSGGFFSGVGTNGNTFNPGIAAQYNNNNKSQDYVISFIYVNEEKCQTIVEHTTTIILSPQVTLLGFNPKREYCLGDNPVTLTGVVSNSTPGAGVYSIKPLLNTELDDNTLNGNIFYPGNSTNAGTYRVLYNYTENTSNCTNTDSVTVIVHSIPQVYFSGLKSKYCDKEELSNLTAFPAYVAGASSFTSSPVVSAVAGTIFSPSLAGVNTHYITYTYTDNNGCKGDSTIKTVVYEKPKASFTMSSFCESDIILFRDSSSVLVSPTSAPSAYNNWKWVIDDKTVIRKDLDTALLAGSHKFSYITITDKGCSDTITKNVTIGSYPKTKFTWDKICNKEATKFFNNSTIDIGAITNVYWKFTEGGSEENIALNNNVNGNTTHTYTTPATYKVTLKAKTNYNCIASDTQKVFILPSIDISSDVPYSNNFNNLVGDWVSSSETDTLSSWVLGQPNKSIIKSDSAAWVTSLTKSHNPNEISYVYSPCFTLTDITKPMIHMDIWSATIQNISGANLQYAVDGTNWFTLGEPNKSGVNWYNNTSNIAARPSGPLSLNQYGWTGTDSAGWKNARHIFDKELGTNKNIRFRISFAGTTDTTNGFAFDNVWIGDRKRLMLAEHFTNNSSSNTVQDNVELNKLLNANQKDGIPKDIIALQYHTAFPGSDPMYSRNIPDAGARSLYYGVTQVPYSTVDGSYYKGNTARITQELIDTRSLYDPAFEIKLEPILTANTISGSVTVKNTMPVNNNVTVYISVLERYVNNITGINGEKNYEWVHAKFLPDAAGKSFSGNWSKDRTETVPFIWSFTPSNIYNPDKLAVIAFVQNNVTKEIYQAAYKGLGADVITSVFDPNESTSTVMMYPNPANDLVHVILSGTLSGDYSWCVIDGLGKVVDQGIAADQTDGFVVNTQHYASGFYTLRLSNQSSGIKTQKFVVVH